ncbi:MAG: TIGR00266 family protein [Deltaproteobacteria bacterium]|nr:MAG: TIGR00266 family protein [Deltaproteobacteria bacterium]
MNLSIQGEGAFQSCRVELNSGESFVSEAGAMVQMTSSIDMDISTRSRGGGGLMGGLKRLLGGDTFFLATYTAREEGHVVVAPTLVGNVVILDVTEGLPLICTGGSFLGCGDEVSLETQFQGGRGMLTGESLFFLELSGEGPALANAFGHVEAYDVDGSYIVDTGHVVAFESSLEYKIGKAGGSWMQSFFAGEGFVFHFHGQGRVWVQSHNPSVFGYSVGRRLPPRQE